MHLPSGGGGESGKWASFSPAGQTQHQFLNLPEHSFELNKYKSPKYSSFVLLKCFSLPGLKSCPLSHISACVGTDVRTGPGTREP